MPSSKKLVDPTDKPCVRLMPYRWSNHVHRLAPRFRNSERAASRPLAQMIHEAQEFSEPKLKPQTREALLEWFNNPNGYGSPGRTTICVVHCSSISPNGSAWISRRRTSWSN